MGAFSNAFITTTLNNIKNGTPHLALYTTNPTAADTGTEVPTYTRKAITFTAPTAVNGVLTISNSADIVFTDIPTANVSHIAVRSAVTGGTMYAFDDLTNVAAIIAGDQLTFPAGSITVRLV